MENGKSEEKLFICCKCKLSKKKEEFYPSRLLPGRTIRCKKCDKENKNFVFERKWARRYREIHAQEYIQKHRERRRRLGINKEYQKKYRLTHKKQTAATNLINHRISNGLMKRDPCVVCGNPISEGHHADYQKPLEVIWLCKRHHRRLHADGG